MKQRFYFDTSVFGGVFYTEFEADSVPLFDKVKSGEITCVYSELTVGELQNAPQKVRDFLTALAKEYAQHTEYLEITDEVFALAHQYLAEKVVGATSFDDCLHIAMATINKADLLVSWNFKHIVNIYRIRGYNSVNIRQGYAPLEIR
ncbi:MAG: type II toxin-antitoxin system VapC family toxin, partial [Bacteroidales bacterium]|nr:type II toxin-antitoxin system VapC family toxin [Bacteroidales bacterium]